MSEQNTFKIPKKKDREIYDVLVASIKEHGSSFESFTCSYLGGNNSYNLLEKDQITAADKVFELDADLVYSFSGNLKGCASISVRRNPSHSFDEFTFNRNPNTRPVTALRLLKILQQNLGAVHLSGKPDVGWSDASQSFYEMRENRLLKLEELHEKLVQGTDEYRRKLDEGYDQKVQKLEEGAADEKRRLTVSFERKSEKLDEDRQALETRIKELDDRESRHARRQIRNDIKEEIKRRKSEFKLSVGTVEKRKPIFWMCMILSVLLGVGMVANVATAFWPSEANTLDTNHIIYFSIRQLAITSAFGAIVVYFIRWNNRWFEQHAQEEFKFQRLELDMDRASWIVEMALEWKQSTGGDIPINLLERLSSNLFDGSDAEEPKDSLNDDLASLVLGSASSLKIKTPEGSEINMDRKGLRKALDQS